MEYNTDGNQHMLLYLTFTARILSGEFLTVGSN